MLDDAQNSGELVVFTMTHDAYNMLRYMDSWTFMRHHSWEISLTVKDVYTCPPNTPHTPPLIVRVLFGLSVSV